MLARVEAVHDDEGQRRRCNLCMPWRADCDDGQTFAIWAFATAGRWPWKSEPTRNLHASNVAKCSRAGIAYGGGLCGGTATPGGAILSHMNAGRAWGRYCQRQEATQGNTRTLESSTYIGLTLKTTIRAVRRALRSRERWNTLIPIVEVGTRPIILT